MSFRPRVIPTLLLKDGALVKGRRFRRHEYVGDPVNAVRMFDLFGADELVLLDIGASRARRTIDPGVIRSIGEESGMPLAVGGGIRDLEAGRALIQAGAEKLVINDACLEDPSVLSRFADEFGSSSIVAGIDVLTRRGRSCVYRHTTRSATKLDPVDHAICAERHGAGELLIQSVEREGTRTGLDISLYERMAARTVAPIIASGGASSLDDLTQLHRRGVAQAFALGSLFVHEGPSHNVLLSFPSQEELESALGGTS